ncbi:MAG: type III-A CRISPR-associated RAMP protein Csm4 [Methylococcales bacterium]|nr:type III-A CRISPR-associated RAMP protein Csm4 [Methylococcales bacterium]MDD5630930.1 type III-A CRISPR-associated RAMP protein Csm4 [Methylococcales bacterium]
MHCYRLYFSSPFHIDSRGDAFHERTETFIHSDTLSAALLSAWALLEPLNIEARAKNPPFKVSSAFPFFKQHYFLPRAICTQTVKLQESQRQHAKLIRKLQWLELPLWKKSFQENWLKAIIADTKSHNEQRIKQNCLVFEHPVPELNQLWLEEERPRLAMDRITNSSSEGQLFHLSRVWFNSEGGLYFLAKFANEQKSGFEAALSLLGDSGIGADRSNGNGFFKVKKVEKAEEMPALRLANSGEMAVALSLVSPSQADQNGNWLDNDNAAYKLISRGGWIGETGVRKQRLRMFAEGSVFSSPLQGQVLNVNPSGKPNPVYRDGRGFFIATR